MATEADNQEPTTETILFKPSSVEAPDKHLETVIKHHEAENVRVPIEGDDIDKSPSVGKTSSEKLQSSLSELNTAIEICDKTEVSENLDRKETEGQVLESLPVKETDGELLKSSTGKGTEGNQIEKGELKSFQGIQLITEEAVGEGHRGHNGGTDQEPEVYESELKEENKVQNLSNASITLDSTEKSTDIEHVTFEDHVSRTSPEEDSCQTISSGTAVKELHSPSASEDMHSNLEEMERRGDTKGEFINNETIGSAAPVNVTLKSDYLSEPNKEEAEEGEEINIDKTYVTGLRSDEVSSSGIKEIVSLDGQSEKEEKAINTEINLPEAPRETRNDESIDASSTEEKQPFDEKNVSAVDLNEEDKIHQNDTAKGHQDALPLVHETEPSQGTQLSVEEPKVMHNIDEADRKLDSIDLGLPVTEGASDVDLAPPCQVDADTIETESRLIANDQNEEDEIHMYDTAKGQQDESPLVHETKASGDILLHVEEPKVVHNIDEAYLNLDSSNLGLPPTEGAPDMALTPPFQLDADDLETESGLIVNDPNEEVEIHLHETAKGKQDAPPPVHEMVTEADNQEPTTETILHRTSSIAEPDELFETALSHYEDEKVKETNEGGNTDNSPSVGKASSEKLPSPSSERNTTVEICDKNEVSVSLDGKDPEDQISESLGVKETEGQGLKSEEVSSSVTKEIASLDGQSEKEEKVNKETNLPEAPRETQIDEPIDEKNVSAVDLNEEDEIHQHDTAKGPQDATPLVHETEAPEGNQPSVEEPKIIHGIDEADRKHDSGDLGLPFAERALEMDLAPPCQIDAENLGTESRLIANNPDEEDEIHMYDTTQDAPPQVHETEASEGTQLHVEEPNLMHIIDGKLDRSDLGLPPTESASDMDLTPPCQIDAENLEIESRLVANDLNEEDESHLYETSKGQPDAPPPVHENETSEGTRLHVKEEKFMQNIDEADQKLNSSDLGLPLAKGELDMDLTPPSQIDADNHETVSRLAANDLNEEDESHLLETKEVQPDAPPLVHESETSEGTQLHVEEPKLMHIIDEADEKLDGSDLGLPPTEGASDMALTPPRQIDAEILDIESRLVEKDLNEQDESHLYDTSKGQPDAPPLVHGSETSEGTPLPVEEEKAVHNIDEADRKFDSSDLGLPPAKGESDMDLAPSSHIDSDNHETESRLVAKDLNEEDESHLLETKEVQLDAPPLVHESETSEGTQLSLEEKKVVHNIDEADRKLDSDRGDLGLPPTEGASDMDLAPPRQIDAGNLEIESRLVANELNVEDESHLYETSKGQPDASLVVHESETSEGTQLHVGEEKVVHNIDEANQKIDSTDFGQPPAKGQSDMDLAPPSKIDADNHEIESRLAANDLNEEDESHLLETKEVQPDAPPLVHESETSEGTQLHVEEPQLMHIIDEADEKLDGSDLGMPPTEGASDLDLTPPRQIDAEILDIESRLVENDLNEEDESHLYDTSKGQPDAPPLVHGSETSEGTQLPVEEEKAVHNIDEADRKFDSSDIGLPPAKGESDMDLDPPSQIDADNHETESRLVANDLNEEDESHLLETKEVQPDAPPLVHESETFEGTQPSVEEEKVVHKIDEADRKLDSDKTDLGLPPTEGESNMDLAPPLQIDADILEIESRLVANDLNEEEESHMYDTSKGQPDAPPLLHGSEASEGTQLPVEEEKAVRNIDEADRKFDSSDLGQPPAKGESDMDLAPPSQTDADNHETESRLVANDLNEEDESHLLETTKGQPDAPPLAHEIEAMERSQLSAEEPIMHEKDEADKRLDNSDLGQAPTEGASDIDLVPLCQTDADNFETESRLMLNDLNEEEEIQLHDKANSQQDAPLLVYEIEPSEGTRLSVEEPKVMMHNIDEGDIKLNSNDHELPPTKEPSDMNLAPSCQIDVVDVESESRLISNDQDEEDKITPYDTTNGQQDALPLVHEIEASQLSVEEPNVMHNIDEEDRKLDSSDLGLPTTKELSDMNLAPSRQIDVVNVETESRLISNDQDEEDKITLYDTTKAQQDALPLSVEEPNVMHTIDEEDRKLDSSDLRLPMTEDASDMDLAPACQIDAAYLESESKLIPSDLNKEDEIQLHDTDKGQQDSPPLVNEIKASEGTQLSVEETKVMHNTNEADRKPDSSDLEFPPSDGASDTDLVPPCQIDVDSLETESRLIANDLNKEEQIHLQDTAKDQQDAPPLVHEIEASERTQLSVEDPNIIHDIDEADRKINSSDLGLPPTDLVSDMDLIPPCQIDVDNLETESRLRGNGLNDEDTIHLHDMGKGPQDTASLVHEIEASEGTQLYFEEPKILHDIDEANRKLDSSDLGLPLIEGASDMDLAQPCQIDAENLEAESNMNSKKELGIMETNTEEELEQIADSLVESHPLIIRNEANNTKVTEEEIEFDSSSTKLSDKKIDDLKVQESEPSNAPRMEEKSEPTDLMDGKQSNMNDNINQNSKPEEHGETDTLDKEAEEINSHITNKEHTTLSFSAILTTEESQEINDKDATGCDGTDVTSPADSGNIDELPSVGKELNEKLLSSSSELNKASETEIGTEHISESLEGNEIQGQIVEHSDEKETEGHASEISKAKEMEGYESKSSDGKETQDHHVEKDNSTPETQTITEEILGEGYRGTNGGMASEETEIDIPTANSHQSPEAEVSELTGDNNMTKTIMLDNTEKITTVGTVAFEDQLCRPSVEEDSSHAISSNMTKKELCLPPESEDVLVNHEHIVSSTMEEEIINHEKIDIDAPVDMTLKSDHFNNPYKKDVEKGEEMSVTPMEETCFKILGSEADVASFGTKGITLLDEQSDKEEKKINTEINLPEVPTEAGKDENIDASNTQENQPFDEKNISADDLKDEDGTNQHDTTKDQADVPPLIPETEVCEVNQISVGEPEKRQDVNEADTMSHSSDLGLTPIAGASGVDIIPHYQIDAEKSESKIDSPKELQVIAERNTKDKLQQNDTDNETIKEETNFDSSITMPTAKITDKLNIQESEYREDTQMEEKSEAKADLDLLGHEETDTSNKEDEEITNITDKEQITQNYPETLIPEESKKRNEEAATEEVAEDESEASVREKDLLNSPTTPEEAIKASIEENKENGSQIKDQHCDQDVKSTNFSDEANLENPYGEDEGKEGNVMVSQICEVYTSAEAETSELDSHNTVMPAPPVETVEDISQVEKEEDSVQPKEVVYTRAEAGTDEPDSSNTAVPTLAATFEGTSELQETKEGQELETLDSIKETIHKGEIEEAGAEMSSPDLNCLTSESLRKDVDNLSMPNVTATIDELQESKEDTDMKPDMSPRVLESEAKLHNAEAPSETEKGEIKEDAPQAEIGAENIPNEEMAETGSIEDSISKEKVKDEGSSGLEREAIPVEPQSITIEETLETSNKENKNEEVSSCDIDTIQREKERGDENYDIPGSTEVGENTESVVEGHKPAEGSSLETSEEIRRNIIHDETNEQNEDQATFAANASDVKVNEVTEQHSITEGDQSKIQDPSLENLKKDWIATKEVQMIENPLPEVPITNVLKDVEVMPESLKTTAQAEMQKQQEANDSNAVPEATNLDTELKFTVDESKTIEQDSTTIRLVNDPTMDRTQGPTATNLADAVEGESLAQLSEVHDDHVIRDVAEKEDPLEHEISDNKKIEIKNSGNLAVSSDNDSGERDSGETNPEISSKHEDIPLLESRSAAVIDLEEVKQVYPYEAVPEPHSTESAEKGASHDHEETPDSPRTASDLGPGFAEKNIPEARDADSQDQHADSHTIQHVQESLMRSQEGSGDDAENTHQTGEITVPTMSSSESLSTPEVDQLTVFSPKDKKDVSQVQEKIEAEGDNIMDEPEELTEKLLPAEMPEESTWEKADHPSETSKLKTQPAGGEVKPEDSAVEKEEHSEPKEGNSGSEDVFIGEKDHDDDTNKINATEVKDMSSNTVSNDMISVQVDPEERTETLISKEGIEVKANEGTVREKESNVEKENKSASEVKTGETKVEREDQDVLKGKEPVSEALPMSENDVDGHPANRSIVTDGTSSATPDDKILVQGYPEDHSEKKNYIEEKETNTDQVETVEEQDIPKEANQEAEVPVPGEKDPDCHTSNRIPIMEMKDGSPSAEPDYRALLQEDSGDCTKTVIVSRDKEVHVTDAEIEKLRPVNASEVEAESEIFESAEEKRSIHDYQEMQEALKSTLSLESSQDNQGKDPAEDTKLNAAKIESKTPENLHPLPQNTGSLTETVMKSDDSNIDISAAEKDMVVEADLKVTQEPENAKNMLQVEQKEAAEYNQAGDKSSECGELGSEPANNNEKTASYETKEGNNLSSEKEAPVVEQVTIEHLPESKKEEVQAKNTGRKEDSKAEKSPEHKYEEVKDEKEHQEDNSGTDLPVMIDSSSYPELKVTPKKSHNLLSGVISKMKKAITCTNSQPMPQSPK